MKLNEKQMNIFEDLIEELKQEDLLESDDTQIKPAIAGSKAFEEVIEAETFLANYKDDLKKTTSAAAESFQHERAVFAKEKKSAASDAVFASDIQQQPAQKKDAASAPSPVDEANYYRRRAIEEVSRLQLVEHVLSGIERDQLKVVPQSYDDLHVKKVLHSFLKISNDINSPEHAQAEFQLMQETEGWYSALAHRDKNISAAHLRRYCETARPVLSSQALISLASFYRNLPYYESARNKFDFVFTKLFSKEHENGKRSFVLERDDLIKHIKELYADWASLAYYAEEEDDSELLLLVFKFEDFMAEAESAENFDELVRKDFFNRLHSFKENIGEKFFAPLITAAAIESNIKIGNRYIDLLKDAREKGSAEIVENKYGFIYDQVISDATSKTLKLVDILHERKSVDREALKDQPEEAVEIATEASDPEIKAQKPKKNLTLYGFNKWLAALTVLSVCVSIGLYLWAESGPAADVSSPSFRAISIENPLAKEFIKEPQVGKEMLFAVVQPAWETASREKKEDVLKQLRSVGDENGFSSVHLQNSNGKTVGAATAGEVVIY